MGKFRVEIEELAKIHIEKHLKAGNKVVIKKLEKIIMELSENPYLGIGNPEALKHELAGLWSRRINQKDRLIYRVREDVVTVFVISAMGHYDKK